MNEFDPHAPFIASDGFEYAGAAERILGERRCTFYNAQVERYIEFYYPARLATFKQKYKAFRQSPQYDDNLAQNSFSGAAVAFEEWCNGPGDDTPYELLDAPDVDFF